jgi:hypothetical protein
MTAARIWEAATKGSSHLVIDSGQASRYWDLSDPSQRSEFLLLCGGLYVEGVGVGGGDLIVEYIARGSEVASDKVRYSFIAADCGDQPRTDNGQRQRFENAFPGLRRCEWSITDRSPFLDLNYNCIAWSVGISDKWIGAIGPPHDPTEYGDEFIDRDYGDNDGLLEISDVDAFMQRKAILQPRLGPPMLL